MGCQRASTRETSLEGYNIIRRLFYTLQILLVRWVNSKTSNFTGLWGFYWHFYWLVLHNVSIWEKVPCASHDNMITWCGHSVVTSKVLRHGIYKANLILILLLLRNIKFRLINPCFLLGLSLPYDCCICFEHELSFRLFWRMFWMVFVLKQQTSPWLHLVKCCYHL